MEVTTEEEFIDKANHFIYSSVRLRGDSNRVMDDINLRNTIGMALGHAIQVPETEAQKQASDEGTYYMFDEKADKHISWVFDQIKNHTKNANITMIKLIPLAIYHKKKMIPLPLFRVALLDDNDNRSRIVDDSGRIYRDDEDWKENNVLPPCLVACPDKLKMGPHMMVSFHKSAEAYFKRNVWQVMDGVAKMAGIVSLIPGLCIPEGQVIVLAALLYGAGRSASALYDRYKHGQSISVFNREASGHWLGLAGAVGNVATLRVLAGVQAMASTGAEFSRQFITILNGLNIANHVVSGVSVTRNTIHLCCNWSSLDWKDRFMIFAQMAFFALAAFNFKTADRIIEQFREEAIQDLTHDMKPEERQLVQQLTNEKNGLVKLLVKINDKVQVENITPRTALYRIINSSSSTVTTGINDLFGIALDLMQSYSAEKICKWLKEFNPDEMNIILKDIPPKVLDFTVEIVKKFNEKVENVDEPRSFMAVIGELSGFFECKLAADQVIDRGENRACYRNLDATYAALDINDRTNINEKIWGQVMKEVNNTLEVSELYDSITNFQALNGMIGAHPVGRNLSQEELVRIIKHGRILFNSEPVAIFNFIKNSMTAGQTDLECFINEANEFITDGNFKHMEVRNDYRFLHYKNEESGSRAVVTEHSGFLWLSSYSPNNIDNNLD